MNDELFAEVACMRNGRSMALFCCREMTSAFVPRANERDECERCLRGAFWAVVQLRKCLADDPSDGEVEMMLGALERFLIGRYGVTAVPEDRVARAQLAAVRALAWSKLTNGR